MLHEAAPRTWRAGIRGAMLDRHGTVLANDTVAYRIDVDWRARPNAAALVSVLRRELSWSSSRTREAERLLDALDPRDPRVHTLERAVGSIAAERIRSDTRALEGVHLTPTITREYPLGADLFHALGYTSSQVSPSWRETPDAPLTEVEGVAGLERVLDAQLRAAPGWERRAPIGASGARDDAAWEQSFADVGEARSSATHDGATVHLTLDADVQRAIAQAFDAQHVTTGAAVVIEARTGRVVAAYSRPTVDPARFETTLSQDDWSALRDDPDRPLLDRFAARATVPGWTMTPFAAAHALTLDAVPASVLCAGSERIGSRRWYCLRTHGGEVDLARALNEHCYLYMFDLAMRVPLDGVAATERSFGFGEPTEWSASPETPGHVVDREWFTRRYGCFRMADALDSIVGLTQHVTPIQLALAWAALINGGDLYAPQWVESIERRDHRVERVPKPEPRRHVDVPDAARESVLRAIQQGASTATDSSADVAGLDAHPPIDPSSPDSNPPRNLWFAGFTPRNDPRYVVVVLAERILFGPEPAHAIAVASATALRETNGGAR